jgi:DNA integrity scanning protein DisA with diadenylate cyclase activity
MKPISRHMVKLATALAREIDAKADLVLADAIENDTELRQLVNTVNFRTILISRSHDAAPICNFPHCERIAVPNVHMTRTGQVKVALLVCLAKGLLQCGDQVVCLTGIGGSSVIDTCMVLNLGSEPELFSATDAVNLGGDVAPAVFERTLTLATQLAVEGREGRPVGAIFVIGDSDNVLAQSRLLVLNPFHGYPESERNILDPDVEDTTKEFAAIDGAFIVRGDGVVITAGSQLLPTALPPQLPKGLGTRHAAAAAITGSTDAVAIVVSQSTGTVTVFKSGQMITDIHKPVNGGRLTI